MVWTSLQASPFFIWMHGLAPVWAGQGQAVRSMDYSCLRLNSILFPWWTLSQMSLLGEMSLQQDLWLIFCFKLQCSVVTWYLAMEWNMWHHNITGIPISGCPVMSFKSLLFHNYQMEQRIILGFVYEPHQWCRFCRRSIFDSVNDRREFIADPD